MKLATFAEGVLHLMRDQLDVDGGDLQDLALKCGVISEVTVTEPCGEDCVCAEVGDFPLVCHVRHPDLDAAVRREVAP